MSPVTSSVPRRLRQNTMVRCPRLISSAPTLDDSAFAEVRRPWASSTIGGLSMTMVRSPRGDPSLFTSVTGTPHNWVAKVAGSPIVAEVKMNLGSDP